jgi:hypothetical protein
MRIRIAHVNDVAAKGRDIFALAKSRKVAWITGVSDSPADVAASAEFAGYTPAFLEDGHNWLAVRADLVKEDTWVAFDEDEHHVYAAFESTVPGLGEVVVASGDVDGEGLGFPLVFIGDTSDSDPVFTYYDELERIQRVVHTEKSTHAYLEKIVTI